MAEITHVDARGRIVLPAALRARLDLTEGTALVIEVDADGSLRLMTRESKARALLGVLASESGLMEELFAMRRADHAQEEVFLRAQGADAGENGR